MIRLGITLEFLVFSQIREENDGLKGRVSTLEEGLAEKVEMLRGMTDKHQNEIQPI